MLDDKLYNTNSEGKEILNYIFKDFSRLYKEIAPNGWINSEYIHFLHPTPKQQCEENKIITDNINKLLKKKNQKEKEYSDESEFKQDELINIPELEEFLYVLGLCVYDIFSNNHEVVGHDAKIYDFGSFRGSGRFIAEFFNKEFDNLNKNYDYLDFYMGSIWIKSRGDLLPFYEFIFNNLKEFNCDWNYSFPRLLLIDPKKVFGSAVDDEFKNYDPEQAMLKEIELSAENKVMNKFKDELDKAYLEKYEEAKYIPLTSIIKAYKNVYGVLPNGHPQKEFE